MKRRQIFLYVFFGLWVAGDGLMFVFKQTYLGICFAIILGVVGILELVAKLATGRTMSQRFVKLHEEKPAQAWALAVIMLLGMLALVLHLML